MSNILNALAQGVDLTLLVPADNTSTATGTGVDVSDYEGVAVAILNSAAGTGTSPTLNAKLQTCSTVSGTYADITGATFTEVTDAADAQEMITFNVSDCEAFVRVLGTIAGTSPHFICGVSFVGMKKAV